MKKILVILSSIFVFAACSGSALDDGRVKVVTTVGMLADVVENIGGDLVSVESLMGSGVDPHLYQPTAGDIRRLEDADLIVYMGLHLEGKMVETLESLAENKSVLAVGERVNSGRLLRADPSDGSSYPYDPHIWFNVDLWKEVLAPVADMLLTHDPENKDVYLANYEKYRDEIAELNAWTVKQIEQIPEESRVLVTAHDAFGYFGDKYKMEVRGLQGISTSSDYGLKDLEELINLIVERKIKAIFVESSVPKKSIEALQEGVRAKGWDVEIGGELFSDAMGDPDTVEGTYKGMLEHNVNTIVNALK